jgi:hypothetical protein
MPRKCAFCPADAVDKGGEHIWEDWLNKELPATKYHAYKQRGAGEIIEYDSHRINEKLPSVCTPCNNGWMSDLAAKTKLVFERAILHGEPFTLGPRDAALLAAFSFMKAVVTAHAIEADGYESFFSRAVRERFRVSLEVPPPTKIWLFAFQGIARFSTKNNLGVINTVDSVGKPSPINGHEFCSHTYVAGKLGLQLLGVRWKEMRNRGRQLFSLKPSAYWDQTAILFWPCLGSTVSWPPPKYIGDDLIKTLIERFKFPVNVRLGRIGDDWYFLP